MKVRWRIHEAFVITIYGIVLLAGFLWRLLQMPADQVNAEYAGTFIKNNLPFSLFRNVLLPTVGVGMLVYILYLLTSFFIVRRALSQGNKFKNYLWVFIQLVLITALLAGAFNGAAYLENEANFNYPGFTFFPAAGYHPQPMMDVTQGIWQASVIVILFVLYTVVRETIIYFIERRGSTTNYRIILINQVTTWLAVYISATSFIVLFSHPPLFKQNIFFSIYFVLIPVLCLLFIANMYWVFPLTVKTQLLSRSIIIRTTSVAIICAIAIAITFSSRLNAGIGFLLSLVALLGIVTPLSWLVFKQQKDKVLQLKRTQKQLVQSNAQLQFLRSQINPHFLFNTLNTLYGAALEENAERTAESIQQLGAMMRFILDENNQSLIDMGKEVEYLQNYIALQKLRARHSSRVTITDTISVEECGSRIAPMLLIPLVENAFKHGISPKEQSWIKIALQCKGPTVFFTVSNSMHILGNAEITNDKTGIGLKNVLERLKIIYAGRHTISVNNDGRVFDIQLTITL